MTLQQFCLRWNNHQPNFISVFTNLLNNAALVDVTLAAEGRHLQAHRVVLSACSSYFQTLFTVNPCQHPIVILKDVKFNDLKTMVDFMYYGEVNVSQEQLPSLLKTAEMLKIKGLAEMPESCTNASSLYLSKSPSVSFDKADMLTSIDSACGLDIKSSPSPLSPAMRRKRLRKSSTGSGSCSTERTSEDTTSEITIIPTSTTVKPEPVAVATATEIVPKDSSLRTSIHEPSTDSEPRDGSQESFDDDPMLLQKQVSQDNSSGGGDIPIAIADTGPWPSTSHEPVVSQASKPGKRGRLLMRQPRIKKECDLLQTSPDSEPSSPQLTSQPLLPVPPVRIETQSSESQQSPPHVRPITQNLLSVPQPSYLVKQHSHPLLPSQKTVHSHTMTPSTVQRQLSTPSPSTTTYNPPPLQVHFVASMQRKELAERTDSPPVQPEVPLLRIAPEHYEESHSHQNLRVRSDELRRSSSSPQASTPREGFELRSVHCPMLRPGPALGCNFCWNTIDAHGRILRRKTKYHCPECQTNLCIVPCFQEYHERNAPGSSKGSTGTILPTVLKPLLPKTSSI